MGEARLPPRLLGALPFAGGGRPGPRRAGAPRLFSATGLALRKRARGRGLGGGPFPARPVATTTGSPARATPRRPAAHERGQQPKQTPHWSRRRQPPRRPIPAGPGANRQEARPGGCGLPLPLSGRCEVDGGGGAHESPEICRSPKENGRSDWRMAEAARDIQPRPQSVQSRAARAPPPPGLRTEPQARRLRPPHRLPIRRPWSYPPGRAQRMRSFVAVVRQPVACCGTL